MRRSLCALALAASLVAPSAAAAATVRATVSPARIGVGEPFTLTIEATAPGASELRILGNAGPFEQLGPSHASHSGDSVRLVETLVCVDRGCTPDAHPRPVALPAPHATAGGVTVAGEPVTVTVVPRVPASAVAAARARYHATTAVPAPRPPIPFVAVGVGASVLAALLALAAALLLARELTRRRSAQASARPREDIGLAAALRLLRESAGRTVDDRRRAADLVARTAAVPAGPEASFAAIRVAWAPPPPGPEDVETLAAQIEHDAERSV